MVFRARRESSQTKRPRQSDPCRNLFRRLRQVIYASRADRFAPLVFVGSMAVGWSAYGGYPDTDIDLASGCVGKSGYGHAGYRRSKKLSLVDRTGGSAAQAGR